MNHTFIFKEIRVTMWNTSLFINKPVRHPRNSNHQQDAIIFLVETANMANDHHTGFDVCVQVGIHIATLLRTPQLSFP